MVGFWSQLSSTMLCPCGRGARRLSGHPSHKGANRIRGDSAFMTYNTPKAPACHAFVFRVKISAQEFREAGANFQSTALLLAGFTRMRNITQVLAGSGTGGIGKLGAILQGIHTPLSLPRRSSA